MARIFSGAVVAPRGMNADYLDMQANDSPAGSLAISRIGRGIVEGIDNYQRVDEAERQKQAEADAKVAEEEAKAKAQAEFESRVGRLAALRQNAQKNPDSDIAKAINSDGFDVVADEWVRTGNSNVIQNYIDSFNANERTKEQIGKQKEMEEKVKADEKKQAENEKELSQLRKDVASADMPLTKREWENLTPEERANKKNILRNLFNRAIELEDVTSQANVYKSLVALQEGKENSDIAQEKEDKRNAAIAKAAKEAEMLE